MAMTMKGFMKGLRYISQIFDEEEEEIEQEIEIGLPTDVKHVAHIGADGPSAFNAPSWVKEFQPGFESTTIRPLGNDKENLGIKFPSTDSRGIIVQNSVASSPRELPKSTRHDLLIEKSGTDLPKKKESKLKHSRKKNSKEFTDGAVKSTRQIQETSLISNSPVQNLPDIPKKSRRKKSKEVVSVGGPSKLRLKADMPNDSFNS